MTMVAVGGSIGTGLLLGSAAALEQAGPSVILSYVIAAFIAYTVAMALGELASMHPAAGSFGLYGELYLNQYVGFLCRAGYWAAIAFSIGAELVASAAYMSYWLPAVPSDVWVIVFSALLLLVNLGSVGSYGRFEFWFSMIKLATIVAFIVAGAALLSSGRVAQQFTANGGFFPKGPIAPLLAVFWAIYAFGGIEMLAVTTGESRSPKDFPRATRLTFLLLAGTYLGAITILVGVMPWNHTGVSESPFVSVLRLAHIPAAAYFMNFVVLTAALSGANAKLYAASRLLFSMGRSGWAPAALGKLNAAGSPRLASAGFLLRNRNHANHQPLGPETSLRLHHGSRLLRPHLLLGSLPGSPRKLPPPPHFPATSRPAHALPPWNLGIDDRLRPSFSHSPPHVIRNPSKRNRRTSLSSSTNRSLRTTKTTPPSNKAMKVHLVRPRVLCVKGFVAIAK